MPFNESGEYIKPGLDPVEDYKSKVRRSEVAPGQFGLAWTSEARTALHNAAAIYRLEKKGVLVTPQTLNDERENITQELEAELKCDRLNNFLEINCLSAQRFCPRKRDYCSSDSSFCPTYRIPCVNKRG